MESKSEVQLAKKIEVIDIDRMMHSPDNPIFMTEPYDTFSTFSDPNEQFQYIQQALATIEELLIAYEITQDVQLIEEISKWANSISAYDNAIATMMGYKEECPKIIIAELIIECLQKLKLSHRLKSNDINLLRLCLEITIEFGWYRHLQTVEDLINSLSNESTLAEHGETLWLFSKALKLANLMLTLEIKRYELKCLVHEYGSPASLTKLLANIAFRMLYYRKLAWTMLFIKRGILISEILDLASYSHQFRETVGLLYLENLGDIDQKLWDIFNNHGVFLDLIQFNRENNEEIRKVIEIYKKSDFKIKQAICQELKNEKSLTRLVSSLETFSQITQIRQDETILFSELFFTEAKDTQWIDSCQGVGYLIVRYDEKWVSLYNTNTGYMTNETGTIFDAQLLQSSSQALYFKVLKRDGWHLFKTTSGLDLENWDDIEILRTLNQYPNSPIYMACKKDKDFSLYKESFDQLVGKFEGINSIRLVCHLPQTILGVESNDAWRLYNLSTNQYLSPFNFMASYISPVNGEDEYLILEDKSGNRCLYNMNNFKLFPLTNIKTVHFAFSDNVFVEDEAGEFFTINKCTAQQLISEGSFRQRLSERLFRQLTRVHLSPPQLYIGLQQHGMAIFGSRVRFEYQMELQGSYHITQDPDNSFLTLFNTVGNLFGMGANRCPVLWKKADNITFMGVSFTNQRDKKAFFLIETNGENLLYVSHYSILKELIDSKEPFEIPYDLYELPTRNISLIHDVYFRIEIDNQFCIFEYPYGIHSNSQADGMEFLDRKNFLKMLRDGRWYLYDLSKRQVVVAEGAKSIERSGENKIVFVYDDYLRYLSYDDLPKYWVPLDLLANHELSNPNVINYIVNLVRLEEYPGLSKTNYHQPFARMLLTYADQHLLKMLTPKFVIAVAQMLDGIAVSTSGLSQALSGILEAIKELSFNKDAIKQIKSKLRSFKKELAQVEQELQIGFAVQESLISDLMTIREVFTKDLATINSQEIEEVRGELNKTVQTINDFLEKIKNKRIAKENFVSILQANRHLLSGSLRYWFLVDPDGKKINDLYSRLIGLVDFYRRSEIHKNGKIIVQKHYLNLIRLYAFDIQIINNFVMAEIDHLDSLRDLFALLDLLKTNEEENKIFNKVKDLAPRTNEQFEKLATRVQEIEYPRLKSIMHALRLIAFARELGAVNIFGINVASFGNVRNEGVYHKFLRVMAYQVRKGFYEKLGIYIDEETIDNIDEQYLVDIMYASENLKDINKKILIIMLKAAIYGLDLKEIFTSSIPIDLIDKKKEQSLLSRIQAHNAGVRTVFDEHKIDWMFWQTGIEEMAGEHISVSLWNRDVAHDLFQGEFCNSCISLSKGNARANLQYLCDFNFSMIEIKDKFNQRTIGHVTIWIGKILDNELVLVLNSIQIHKRYQKYSAEVRHLVFEYAAMFARILGIGKTILGQGYNAVPVQILREIDDAGQDISGKNWFQSSYKKNEGNEVVTIEDVSMKILANTFNEEWYSDVYFDGWIKTEEMADEYSAVWNISCFIQNAQFLPSTDLSKRYAEILKDFEVWIVKNSRLTGVQLCNVDNADEPNLILIGRAYWEKYHESGLEKICQIIQSSKKLPRCIFSDQFSSSMDIEEKPLSVSDNNNAVSINEKEQMSTSIDSLRNTGFFENVHKTVLTTAFNTSRVAYTDTPSIFKLNNKTSTRSFGQSNPSIKRDPLHDIDKVKTLLKNHSHIPADFQLGTAIGKGDCFFDAVAQGLNQLTSEQECDVKSLRLFCESYVKTPDHTWVKDAVLKDKDNYEHYLTRIAFTVEEMASAEWNISKDPAVWGRPLIEGRMICEQYNIQLHVIEILENEDASTYVMEQLVTKQGSRSIESMAEEAYTNARTLHVVVYRNHFVPLLSKATYNVELKEQSTQFNEHSRFFRSFSKLSLSASPDKKRKREKADDDIEDIIANAEALAICEEEMSEEEDGNISDCSC